MKLTMLALVAVAAAVGIVAVRAQDDVKVPDHLFVASDELAWIDGPPALPAGAKLAVIEGNPATPGPFTMRLKVSDGYKVPPHFHPAIEHVSVMSGTLNIGAGDAFDASKTKALGSGGFAVMQTGVKHFVWMKDETVIQIHGMGPWGITYVNPADDPRNAKK
jgi:hypothetical protein